MNKYLYLFVVQGHYGDQYGWEDLCQSEDFKEARGWVRDYNRNEAAPHRLIKRREPNPDYTLFCGDGCRDCYREDRRLGLIYGGMTLPSVSVPAGTDYTRLESGNLHVGWEDGCRILGICCYCGQHIEKEG